MYLVAQLVMAIHGEQHFVDDKHDVIKAVNDRPVMPEAFELDHVLQNVVLQ